MPDSTSHSGICYLVGAGPGDLGLVTLKARECIEKADVLVYDYLCNPAMLAWAPAACEVIYAGKKAGNHALKQGEINALLVEKARAGKIVVRLKGGDPYVFGRGAEEAQDLAKAGLAFEVVPGISSVIAAPAYAGIPVTHREFVSQLTIFTGHEDPGKATSSLDFAAIAKAEGTKVMLMGVERIDAITRQLIAKGMDPATPVAMIRWATTGRQQTIRGRVDDIARIVLETGFEAPAVAIFGDVVNLRDELNWFEKRPLFGRRIVVTRTRSQAGALSARLAALGADVIELPTIRIEPPVDVRAFAELVVDAHTYDWLVFTSPNGVNAFFEVFYRAYTDAREIGGVKIAAIGPATAQRVKDFRLLPNLQPKEFVTEGLIEAFLEEGALDNQKVLIVRAEKTRDLLAGALTKQGAIVDEAVGYRTVPETAVSDRTGTIERFRNEGADLITFASSSAVDSFVALKLPLPTGIRTASMGPVTSRTLRKHGLAVDIEAPKPSLESFADAIARYYAV
ncbi:HemD protein [Verrucomicrobia bacterium SCGC AG-212-E04]|nr:HemD protein [Verrucomicrobia bacterium SCGC AG-212-E04]